MLPLRTAIKIGADEGFELAKATLCLNGFHLYSQIWNDQPPLNTFLVTQIVKYSPSVFAPRVMTLIFAIALLIGLYYCSLWVDGMIVAFLTTLWMIASPGFLELSCSVMQEVPALAPIVCSLAILLGWRGAGRSFAQVLAGIVFAFGLEIKFIGIIYLPLAALIIWLRELPVTSKRQRLRGQCRLTNGQSPAIQSIFTRGLLWSFVRFGTGLCLSFALVTVVIGEGSYWNQLQQSWTSHFASAKSFEYGSPEDHPFEWSVLLKNWDATVPALIGVVACCKSVKRNPTALLPIVWLFLTLSIFAWHKPWWTYYYIHDCIPLSWCAAIGTATILGWLRRKKHKRLFGTFVAFAVGTACWLGARVYFEIEGIRDSPRLYTALVLKEMETLRPFTKFIYTDEPVYSFHSRIPIVPSLGVVSLKRFWCGDLNNDRLVRVLESTKPGMVLLNNDSRESPFNHLLLTDYRIIYQDSEHTLYALKTVLAVARAERSGL